MAISTTDQLGRQRPIMSNDRSSQLCFAGKHSLSSRGRTAPGVPGCGNRDYTQKQIRANQRTHYSAWPISRPRHLCPVGDIQTILNLPYPILIIEARLGVPRGLIAKSM
jgi:hypothetical protein